MMKVKFKKLSPDAILPKKSSSGAAAFDLYAAGVRERFEYTLTLRTQLAAEITDGHAMFIFSRSGQGFNHGVRLANCVGVIDSDYRGEILVKMTGDDIRSSDYFNDIKHGDRIAQFVILQIPAVEIVEAETLSETVRGSDGFGSTGK